MRNGLSEIDSNAVDPARIGPTVVIDGGGHGPPYCHQWGPGARICSAVVVGTAHPTRRIAPNGSSPRGEAYQMDFFRNTNLMET